MDIVIKTLEVIVKTTIVIALIAATILIVVGVAIFIQDTIIGEHSLLLEGIFSVTTSVMFWSLASVGSVISLLFVLDLLEGKI